MAVKPLSREGLFTQLAETPRHIGELTADLTPTQLRTPPVPGEWSANDVLAHLRSCADVWGECINRMLAEDRPTMRAIDPRSWTPRTDYPDLAFRPSLDAFVQQRAKLLSVLESLSPGDWARTAILTGAGAPIERTVRSFVERLAIHERPHVKQIARIVRVLTST